MKLGDALHIIWQHSHGSAIHGSPIYYNVPGVAAKICLNDIRAIWEYLNQDVPLEGTIIDATSGNRSEYVSERGGK